MNYLYRFPYVSEEMFLVVRTILVSHMESSNLPNKEISHLKLYDTSRAAVNFHTTCSSTFCLHLPHRVCTSLASQSIQVHSTIYKRLNY